MPVCAILIYFHKIKLLKLFLITIVCDRNLYHFDKFYNSTTRGVAALDITTISKVTLCFYSSHSRTIICTLPCALFLFCPFRRILSDIYIFSSFSVGYYPTSYFFVLSISRNLISVPFTCVLLGLVSFFSHILFKKDTTSVSFALSVRAQLWLLDLFLNF